MIIHPSEFGFDTADQIQPSEVNEVPTDTNTNQSKYTNSNTNVNSKLMKKMKKTLVELMAIKTILKDRIRNLNPYKKKDAKKIAKLNLKLEEVKDLIKQYKKVTGYKKKKFYRGSRMNRFFNKIKRKISINVKRIKKKAKKFYNKNKDIIGVGASVAVPAVIAAIGKRLIGIIL